MKTRQDSTGKLFCEVELDGKTVEREAHIEVDRHDLLRGGLRAFSRIRPQLFDGESLIETVEGKLFIIKDKI